ncbi:MAG: hypothetical protein ACK56K_00220 [Akkermansiaceae bacterium]
MTAHPARHAQRGTGHDKTATDSPERDHRGGHHWGQSRMTP